MPVNIRPYNDTADRAQVMALWRVTFGYETAHNEPGLAIDKKLAVNDGLFFVAAASTGVVGTAMAGYDGHRGWLYSIAVDPQCQRSGLGSQLARFAEDALTRAGCLKINLQLVATNAATAAFYESLGYVLEPRVNMGKVLRANLPTSSLSDRRS